MGIEQIQQRLKELKQAEFDAFAQLHAVQGAIYELESYWLPLLEKPEEKPQDALTESQLEEMLGGKIEHES